MEIVVDENVNIFTLEEDESFFVEKSKDEFFLQFLDIIIYLDKPYVLNGLSIIQEGNVIQFKDDAQLNVFQEILKVVKDAS